VQEQEENKISTVAQGHLDKKNYLKIAETR
jgi:hypothetical protein